MRRNLLVSLVAWVLLVICSTSTLSQVKPDAQKYGGLLWKAQREQFTLYLYGAAHGSNDVLEINSEVRQLIESSDTYVSELQLGKRVEYPAELKTIYREYIEKPFVLSSTAEKAFSELQRNGVIGAYQYWTLRHQSPITATRGVYAELLYKKYADQQMRVTELPKSRLGPDRIALNLAASRNINIIQIEPQHIADLYWLRNCDTERDNSAYLLSVIDMGINRIMQFQILHQQILEGDFAGFQKSVDEDMVLDFPRLDYQCHVIDRNKLWAHSLNQLATNRETSLRSEKSTLFFTFGAMHAVSPKAFPGTSLLDLLRQQGWQIQPMPIKL